MRNTINGALARIDTEPTAVVSLNNSTYYIGDLLVELYNSLKFRYGYINKIIIFDSNVDVTLITSIETGNLKGKWIKIDGMYYGIGDSRNHVRFEFGLNTGIVILTLNGNNEDYIFFRKTT